MSLKILFLVLLCKVPLPIFSVTLQSATSATKNPIFSGALQNVTEDPIFSATLQSATTYF
jgi:hypothetical protein